MRGDDFEYQDPSETVGVRQVRERSEGEMSYYAAMDWILVGLIAVVATVFVVVVFG